MVTTSSVDTPVDYDLAIIGPGPVGMALATTLARRGGTTALSIALIDARDADAARRDPRVLALSHGSRILLDPLGWPDDVTPIERIHVSQRGHFGRALIDRDEHALSALGYVVRYGVLCASLRAGLDRMMTGGARIDLIERHEVIGTAQDAQGVTLRIAARADDAVPYRSLRARIVIHAEGGLFSKAEARDATVDGGDHAGKGDRTTPDATARHARDYGQTAIVGTVRCSAPQPGVAWERFTEAGPIALLPLGGAGRAQAMRGQARRPLADAVNGPATPAADIPADYALVWCQSPDEAQRRMTLDDADFLSALDVAFGDRVGRFTQIAGKAMFPLGLNRRRSPVDGRTAAIGNAAQTLHPVAGQGLNLGLRDAEALASALAQQGATPAALAAFASKRRIDRYVTIGLTDLLARGFTIDFPPLAVARGLALAALDVLPGAKTLLARQMMFGQRR